MSNPFEAPECEAFDIFVNEVVCVGKGCPYSYVKATPHAFSFSSSTGTAYATSQGTTCCRVVPQKLHSLCNTFSKGYSGGASCSILNMPFGCSAEADLLYCLVVKAKLENNR